MNELTYETWLADYQARREALWEEFSAASHKATEIDASGGWSRLKGNFCTEDARQYARKHRAGFENKFCLLLWSTDFNENIYRSLMEGEDVDIKEVRGILTHKASNFYPRIGRLTARLDIAGYYALMIWPEGWKNPPPQPLIVSPPDVLMPSQGQEPCESVNMWFYVFSLAIELAQAIVIESNAGEGLLNEMKYIHEVGLDGRVLLFDNNDELYRHDEDHRWPLESIEQAVAYAANQ